MQITFHNRSEESIRIIKDAAKQAVKEFRIPFPAARRHLIRQTHKHLTTAGVSRRRDGHRLGLKERILMAENA